jgi:L-tartrate/succinate antiporter
MGPHRLPLRGFPPLYGSAPGATSHRIGGYVMWTAFATTGVTSAMFVTALAPNLLAVSLMSQIASVQMTWTSWLLGFLPIGTVLFITQPLLIYWIYPPTVKASAAVPTWANRELVGLGPLGYRETMMALLALLSLALWIFGGRWMTATAVALLTLCPHDPSWRDRLK